MARAKKKAKKSSITTGWRPTYGPRNKPRGKCHWEKIGGKCVAVRRTGYGKPKPCSTPEGKNPCTVKLVRRKRALRGAPSYVPVGSAPAKRGRTSRCVWRQSKGRCFGWNDSKKRMCKAPGVNPCTGKPTPRKKARKGRKGRK